MEKYPATLPFPPPPQPNTHTHTEKDLSCRSRNIIYLVTCRRCGLQYVGETSQELRQRMNQHRTAIRGNKRTILSRHFNDNDHSVSDFHVQPIEQIIRRPGESDVEVKRRRLEREEFWMRELCTLYPYGLNDKLHSVGNLSQLDKDAVIWRFFNSHHRKRRPISGQKRHHRRKQRSRYTNIRQCIDEVLNLYPCNNIIHRLKEFCVRTPKMHPSGCPGDH